MHTELRDKNPIHSESPLVDLELQKNSNQERAESTKTKLNSKDKKSIVNQAKNQNIKETNLKENNQIKKPKKFKKPNEAKDNIDEKEELFSKFLKEIKKTELFKIIPDIGLTASIVGNGFSSLANFFKLAPNIKSFANQLGSLGTKAFLFINGNVNVVEQLERKNYFLAAAYFLENVVMVISKQANVFLARGIVSGAYNLGNALNMINKKTRFKNLEENAVHVISGFKKAFKRIINDPINSIKSSETGVLSIIAGAMKILGTSIWLTTGQEILASTIRNSANILQNIEQLKIEHSSKRPNFFIAGIGTSLAAVFDYLSKWSTNSKDTLVPLSLLTDYLGIYFLRRSQNAEEMSLAKDVK